MEVVRLSRGCAPVKPSGKRWAGMDGCGVVGGVGGWQEQAGIDETRSLSDGHSEAGPPRPQPAATDR